MGLRSKKDKDQSSTNMSTFSNKSNTVFITRLESGDQGTFGKLIYQNKEWYTLELPWRENKSNISCIPKGKYTVSWTYSPKFKRKMYLVVAVPNRSGIRIHSANYAGDESKGYKKHLYGCIALGKRKGILEGQKAILVSRPAIREFEKLMKEDTFKLEII